MLQVQQESHPERGEAITHQRETKENSLTLYVVNSDDVFFDGNMQQAKVNILGVLIVWWLYWMVYANSFRSSIRMTIYLLFRFKLIDLRKISVPMNPNLEDFAAILDEAYHWRFKKKDLINYLQVSNNTFNGLFKELLEEKGYAGRRSFTTLEVYHILKDWINTDTWYRVQAFSKKELAAYLHAGNYKKLAAEFNSFQGENTTYKQNDKLPPKLVYAFLVHIGLDKAEIEEVFTAKYYKEV